MGGGTPIQDSHDTARGAIGGGGGGGMIVLIIDN